MASGRRIGCSELRWSFTCGDVVLSGSTFPIFLVRNVEVGRASDVAPDEHDQYNQNEIPMYALPYGA